MKIGISSLFAEDIKVLCTFQLEAIGFIIAEIPQVTVLLKT